MASVCGYPEGWTECKAPATIGGLCQSHYEEMEEEKLLQQEEIRLSTFPLVARPKHVFVMSGSAQDLVVVASIPKKPKGDFVEAFVFGGNLTTETGPKRVYKVFRREYTSRNFFLHVDMKHPRCKHGRKCECSLKQESTVHVPVLFLPVLPEGL